MTDLLARIAFSDDSDFLAQALAPGLPMLDGRKLAYQVLLGWFGDMLAEPELDEDGVHFYVQSRGQRLRIAEHALATESDLKGHLAGDYDRLKKALFDVRPVSPSERLIFNRLEPPIVNHAGFLYRVRPAGSSDRLVWCWGFQRRRNTGDVMLCPHEDCSLLFIRQDTSLDVCPRCEQALFRKIVAAERRTTFPTGAVAATVMLSGLVGATYWIASVSGDEGVDALPVLAAVSPPELDEPVRDDAVTDNDSGTPHEDVENGKQEVDRRTVADADDVRDDASTSEGLSDMKPLAIAQIPAESADAPTTYGDEPLRPFAASDEPRRFDLPESANPFDATLLVDRVPPEEKEEKQSRAAGTKPSVIPPAPEASSAKRTVTTQSVPKETLPLTSPEPDEPSVSETPSVSEKPPVSEARGEKPPLAAEPRNESEESEQVARTPVGQSVPQPAVAASEKSPAEVPSAESPNLKPSTVAGAATIDSNSEPASENSTAQPAAEPVASAGGWSTDYVASYQRAIAERRYLIMLFRDPDGSATEGVSLADLPNVEDLPGFNDSVRVVVPTTMPVPGQPVESAGRLLDHRSFRHLQGAAGIAIVDLTRTDSPNFGRVVSAFPEATDRRSIVDALQPARSLPEGTISQRSLLLAMRTGLPQSAFADRGYDPALNELANRNSRYMAHLNEAGLFETESRRNTVREQFGENAQLKELVFASESATTIQTATVEAIEHWRASGELADEAGKSSIRAFGLELFQSPTNGRWFATLLIVNAADGD